MSIPEQLRQAARDRKVTCYRLWRETGIPVAAIQQWWHGGGLRCSSAEKIAAALGLEIVLRPARKRKGKRA